MNVIMVRDFNKTRVQETEWSFTLIFLPFCVLPPFLSATGENVTIYEYTLLTTSSSTRNVSTLGIVSKKIEQTPSPNVSNRSLNYGSFIYKLAHVDDLYTELMHWKINYSALICKLLNKVASPPRDPASSKLLKSSAFHEYNTTANTTIYMNQHSKTSCIFQAYLVGATNWSSMHEPGNLPLALEGRTLASCRRG
jgi:hypothetical protein